MRNHLGQGSTVRERHADRHTHRFELPVEPGDVDTTAARLWLAGALGLWERPGVVVAWFRDRVPHVPPGGVWSIEPDHDWQSAWKETIQPVQAGAITVVPTWLATDAPPSRPVPTPAPLTVVLDPGRAFGSGHHATTLLCLERLDAQPLAGRRVADIGCGSGILGIAAALRGAHVTAVDVDPVAVDTTLANAARNGVEIGAHVGSVERLAGPVDIVVANLVTDVILMLATELVASTGDILVVSGIGTERRAAVEGALTAAGADVTAVTSREGWVAIEARVVHRHTSDRSSSDPPADRTD